MEQTFEEWKSDLMQNRWKNYYLLIAEIAKTDMQAALALRNIALNPPPEFCPDRDLLCCFLWEESEQGASYWEAVYNKAYPDSKALL